MSHSDCPECLSLHESNVRLRAKVERLTRELQSFRDWSGAHDDCYDLTHVDLQRERDEALAQVAVFVKECSCQDWTSERLFSMFVDKARVLLDRLRRAEAVVEAVLRVREDCRKAFADGEIEGTRLISEMDLHQALAAWEEGKA